jgi:hypothetical protein
MTVRKDQIMLQSHVIVIDGDFVGAAVRLDTGYRFIATNIRLEELDGTTWPSLGDVQRLARRLFHTGRFDAPPQPNVGTGAPASQAFT